MSGTNPTTNPNPPTNVTPIRLRAYAERALSAGWEPTPHHTTLARELTTQQLAAIRAGYDGTALSLRRLADQLTLPLYVVRESALALRMRNPQQPPRKRYTLKRSTPVRLPNEDGEEVAS